MSLMLRNTARHISARFRPSSRSLTLSSVEGPLHPPLATTTLSEYFSQEILSKYSNRPALICPTEAPRAHGGPPPRNWGDRKHLAWDFEEFDRNINAFARGLLNMGVKPGDRVGVVMGNNRYAPRFILSSIQYISHLKAHMALFNGLVQALVCLLF